MTLVQKRLDDARAGGALSQRVELGGGPAGRDGLGAAERVVEQAQPRLVAVVDAVVEQKGVVRRSSAQLAADQELG
eukprot:4648944-Pleurochrysis_carterae.AAC.1